MVIKAQQVTKRLEDLGYPEKVHSDEFESLVRTPSLRLEGFLQWFLQRITPQHSLSPQELDEYRGLKHTHRGLLVVGYSLMIDIA